MVTLGDLLCSCSQRLDCVQGEHGRLNTPVLRYIAKALMKNVTTIAVLFLLVAVAVAQTASSGAAVVEGTISDSQNMPLKDAEVILETADHGRKLGTHSDAQGQYHFDDVPTGTYTLTSSKVGFAEMKSIPFVIELSGRKKLDFHLTKSSSPTNVKEKPGVQFSDEPQFQIAGIADPSNYGGHGSDIGVRTKEALARDMDSLKRDSIGSTENSANADAAALHRQKGDAAETEGRPLDAVREYQLAAELQPSEPNLFVWGAELLLHRAFEPAIEVFAKGQNQFRSSVRMAVGLSIATYDKGETDRGEELLLKACDVNVEDPVPYQFMGRLQEAKKIVSHEWSDKLHRFTILHPENPLAHYYYAVALSKQTGAAENRFVIEAELKKAIELDSQLGPAYLQLGILHAEKKDNSAAIAAFEKAIENSPLADEAHYRLAQIYRQTGDIEKAHQQIVLYKQSSQQKAEQEEEQRHEIQQFVYTLREQKPDNAAGSKAP
jgi:tetratricopeptide (TPR) repeat protein